MVKPLYLRISSEFWQKIMIFREISQATESILKGHEQQFIV